MFVCPGSPWKEFLCGHNGRMVATCHARSNKDRSAHLYSGGGGILAPPTRFELPAGFGAKLRLRLSETFNNRTAGERKTTGFWLEIEHVCACPRL